jgi:hypothetical protein
MSGLGPMIGIRRRGRSLSSSTPATRSPCGGAGTTNRRAEAPELLTVAGTALLLRLSRATAYRLVESGEIPAHLSRRPVKRGTHRAGLLRALAQSRRATAGSWPRSTRKLPATTASTWRLDTPNGPPMDRERLAAHEAGQAVAAHLMDRVVTMVSLDYAPQVGGSTSPTTSPGPRRKPGVEPCRTHVLHLEAAPTRRRRGRPPRRPRRGKAGARSCRHPRAPRRRPRKPPARPSPRARSARRGSAATGPIQN